MSIDQRGTMGSCPSDETIAAFVDGVLSDAERAEVERHARSCERCYDLLVELGCLSSEIAAESAPDSTPASAAPPRMRSPLWWWGTGLALAASIAVIAAASGVLSLGPATTSSTPARQLGSRAGDTGLDDDGARRALIEQVGSHRTAEARLTGFSWGTVPSVLRSGNELARRPPAILAAAGLALQATDQQETPAAHRVAGLAYLLLGDYERAIERLEEARQSTPAPPASVLSDLAAAYLERGRLQDRAADLAKGADLAGQAVVRPDPPAAAWFNRALALEQLGLRDRAIAAWKDYLARAAPTAPGAGPAADESRWIDEARQRVRDLEEARPTTNWLRERELLVDGSAFSRPGEVARLGEAWPAGVREYVQDTLLPAWGTARLGQDRTAADQALTRARALAETVGGDGNRRLLTTMIDRITHIERTGTGAAITRLATGLVDYGEGRRLYEQNDVAQASRRFERATASVPEMGVLAEWSRLHEAIGLYFGASFDQSRRLIADAMHGADAADDPALRGRCLRLLAVMSARLGDLNRALALQLEARINYRAARDSGEVTRIEASLAETSDLMGRRHDAWKWMRSAIQNASRAEAQRRDENLYSGIIWACLRQALPSLAGEAQVELSNRLNRRNDPLVRFESTVLAARLLRQSGRTEEARSYAQSAQDALPLIADETLRQRASFELAVEILTSDSAAGSAISLERVSDAIDSSRRAPLQFRSPELYLTRARLHLRLGNPKAACEDLRAGLAVVEEQRQLPPATRLRLALSDRRRDLLFELIDLSARLDPGGRQAWLAAEQYRGLETYSQMPAGTDDDIVSLQTSLDADSAVVSYALTNDASYVWLVSSRRFVFHRIEESPTRLATRMRLLHRQIVAGSPLARRTLVELYRLLVQPVTDPSGAFPRQVVLVTDGCLDRVPFGALQASSGAEPLALTTMFSRAVSARALGIPSTGPLRRPARAVAIVVKSGSTTDRPALPRAMREAETVLSAYRSKRLVIRDETQAITPADFEGADVVHVVSHARPVDDDDSPHPDLENLGPGLEAQMTRVRAELVVLSACATATGRAAVGEGPRSEVMALVRSGARRVVGTLWDVRDEDAYAVMGPLHAAIASGVAIEHALQRVQADLIRAGRPIESWAPYVLYRR